MSKIDMARVLKDFDLNAAKKDKHDKINADFDDKGTSQKKQANPPSQERSSQEGDSVRISQPYFYDLLKMRKRKAI